jgi:RHS repeat-associated protein
MVRHSRKAGGRQTHPTDYRYTGQLQQAVIGLDYYNARWYDPQLGRFVQADTIVANPYTAASYDRYSYVNNNPISHNDPTGHVCDEDGNCYNNYGWYAAPGAHFSVNETWEKMIGGSFGIKMSDAGNKKWDTANLSLMYNSLSIINNALNGHLRSMVHGATFWLMNHTGTTGVYNGATNTDRNEPTGIHFYTIGTDAIRQMNIFHEFGHLLDNTPGTWDVFTNDVTNAGKVSWVSGDQKINPAALKSRTITNDPNYPSVQARQAFSNFGPSEQWADAFANYVAGNIDLSNPNGPGIDMYHFVGGALAPYIDVP